ncbi:MAG: hypothetical protein ACLP01_15700 [Solirubrobacteraceae bacterium]
MALRKKARASAETAAVSQASPSVGRLVEDAELRATLREAIESTERAYSRLTSRKRAQKTSVDKKLKAELHSAVKSLKSASGKLGDGAAVKGRRSKGGLGLGASALLLTGGTVVVVATCPWMRGKVLDALFGAEEEFEYSPPPMPEPSAPAGVDASTPAATDASAPAGVDASTPAATDASAPAATDSTSQ